MYCWICNKKLIKYTDYNLLPEKENIYDIPIIKDTYELITINQFTFLYYTVCSQCLIMYLDYYPFSFHKIIKRELYI